MSSTVVLFLFTHRSLRPQGKANQAPASVRSSVLPQGLLVGAEPLSCSPGLNSRFLPYPPVPTPARAPSIWSLAQVLSPPHCLCLFSSTRHPSNSSHWGGRLFHSGKDSPAQVPRGPGAQLPARGCHSCHRTHKVASGGLPSPNLFGEKHKPDKRQPRAGFRGTQSRK